MHLVVPRGTHTHDEVAGALPKHFSIVQWWPVTLVTCDIHGSECQAQGAMRYVQDVLHNKGIPSQVMLNPAIRCNCGE